MELNVTYPAALGVAPLPQHWWRLDDSGAVVGGASRYVDCEMDAVDGVTKVYPSTGFRHAAPPRVPDGRSVLFAHDSSPYVASGYIDVATILTAANTGFSFEAFVKKTTTAGGIILFAGTVGASGEWTGFEFGVTAGGFPYLSRWVLTIASTAVGTASLNDLEWHHVVVTNDATTTRFYVDGVLAGAIAQAWATSVGSSGGTPSSWIGFRNVNGATAKAGFTGYLSEVATYASVLNQTTITEHAIGWRDVSADLVTRSPIRVQRGMSDGPTDLVADTGVMTFALDNTAQNSAGLVGFYSASHANKWNQFRLGMPVRLTITHLATPRVMFVGTLDRADPSPGRYSLQLVMCTALDYMDDLARARLSGIQTLPNKRSDELFSTVIDAMPRQPTDLRVGEGRDTYVYGLNSKRESVEVLTEIERIATSEFGRVYVKADGTLVFEERHARLAAASSAATFNETMVAAPVSFAREQMVNYVNVQIHPRSIDTADVVLFSLENGPEIPPGATKVLLGAFADPEQKDTLISATGLIAPVANLDYRFNRLQDGSGIDVTSDFTVSVDLGSGGVRFTMTNNGTNVAYATLLQVRGRGLYDHTSAQIELQDEASQSINGFNPVTLDMYYQTQADVAEGVAQYILDTYKSPSSRLRAITILGLESDAMMTEVLLREISDRITVVESVSGVNGVYHINGVTLEIEGPYQISATWVLVPAVTTQFWTLGVVGLSELGTTTLPAYA